MAKKNLILGIIQALIQAANFYFLIFYLIFYFFKNLASQSLDIEILFNIHLKSSGMRQKCESQNGGYRKIKFPFLQKTNISHPLRRTRHKVRNVNFSENSEHVLNGWFLTLEHNLLADLFPLLQKVCLQDQGHSQFDFNMPE